MLSAIITAMVAAVASATGTLPVAETASSACRHIRHLFAQIKRNHIVML